MASRFATVGAAETDGQIILAVGERKTTIAGRSGEVAIEVDLDPGPHAATVEADVADTGVRRSWTFTVAPSSVTRISGPTRIETAAAIADQLPDRSGEAAVLARADDYADALAGVGLAHTLDAPLLLTSPAALDPATRTALERHVGPGGRVVVLGGSDAVGDDVVTAVRALGFAVSRVAGADRYATAAAVATAQLDAADADTAQTVVLASGAEFADALTASVPAARRGWPVLLTPPDALGDAAADFFADARVEQVQLVGGPAAVAPAVQDAAAASVAVRRTAGRDRYATARAVAERFMPDMNDAGSEGPDAAAGVALASGTTFADALAGGVLAAAEGMPLLLSRTRLPETAGAYLEASTPSRLVVFGGPAAVPNRAVDDALRSVAQVDPPAVERDPPSGTPLQTTTGNAFPPLLLTTPGATLTEHSDASVWVGDRELPTVVERTGDRLSVRIAADGSLPTDREVMGRLRAGLYTAEGDRDFIDSDVPLRVRHPVVTTPEGFAAVDGRGELVGSSGSLRTYSLEVEPATGWDVRHFAAIAERQLSDPRGWTAGRWRLQRVPPAEADIRVVLARPATVDGVCARAGLNTAGIYSCWNGTFAAINLDRWERGAAAFRAPLDVYRGYVLNHEVGHGLGYGHRGCPAAAAPAPVMVQQTVSTGACRPNAWPFP